MKKPKALVAAATKKLKSLRQCYFAFAWYPDDGSIVVRELRVNGTLVTPPQGQADDDGTFLVELGSFQAGTELEFKWSVALISRSWPGAFRGIWALATTADRQWDEVGQAADLDLSERWESKGTYVVR